MLISGFFFFFKQKTAYEVRISDWSSDVCSSDLFAKAGDPFPGFGEGSAHILVIAGPARQPSARKAQRMSRMEQVHDRRASRQFLFPKRDLAALDWRGKRDDQCRRLMRELVHRLYLQPSGLPEERRVGQEWVSTCRYLWGPVHK